MENIFRLSVFHLFYIILFSEMATAHELKEMFREQIIVDYVKIKKSEELLLFINKIVDRIGKSKSYSAVPLQSEMTAVSFGVNYCNENFYHANSEKMIEQHIGPNETKSTFVRNSPSSKTIQDEV